MYAQYPPANVLKLGDYGGITKEGDFISSGNILQDHPSLKDELGENKTLWNNKHFSASGSRKKAAASVFKP